MTLTRATITFSGRSVLFRPISRRRRVVVALTILAPGEYGIFTNSVLASCLENWQNEPLYNTLPFNTRPRLVLPIFQPTCRHHKKILVENKTQPPTLPFSSIIIPSHSHSHSLTFYLHYYHFSLSFSHILSPLLTNTSHSHSLTFYLHY